MTQGPLECLIRKRSAAKMLVVLCGSPSLGSRGIVSCGGVMLMSGFAGVKGMGSE